jgi:hypothetical protein
VVAHSEPGTIKDLRIQFEEYFLRYNVPTLELCVKDLKQYFGVRGDDYYLNKIIREYFFLEKTSMPLSYMFYHDFGGTQEKEENVHLVKSRGRYFTFKKEDFVKP